MSAREWGPPLRVGDEWRGAFDPETLTAGIVVRVVSVSPIGLAQVVLTCEPRERIDTLRYYPWGKWRGACPRRLPVEHGLLCGPAPSGEGGAPRRHYELGGLVSELYIGELFIDLFAGGGGTSEGVCEAIGRDPHYAVNHNPVAVAMHIADHPDSRHFVEDVFAVDPVRVCRGRPVRSSGFRPIARTSAGPRAASRVTARCAAWRGSP